MTELKRISGNHQNPRRRKEDRLLELRDWDRENAEHIAEEEGVTMQEEHWQVVAFLRNYYLEHGKVENTRAVAEALYEAFKDKGGNHYLRHLFPEGAVSQGSRIAGLPFHSQWQSKE
jgi:tRNA 2-thiouridine synthesizing protein E